MTCKSEEDDVYLTKLYLLIDYLCFNWKIDIKFNLRRLNLNKWIKESDKMNNREKWDCFLVN